MNPYDSAGHIYVNGFGFVSEDPWFRENRALFKNAVVIGLVLIGILVLPTLCLYPVRLLLNILFTPFYYLGGSAYASVGLQRVYSETERLLLELLAVGIPLIFSGLLLRPRRKGLFLTRKPSPNLFRGSVAMCMGVWVLCALVSNLSNSLLQSIHLVELHPENSMPNVPAATLIYLIRVLLIPALLEEFLFRGVILRSLRQFGDSFAILVSAVSFGLIHYNLSRDLKGFALGLALGYFVIRSGSVWTAVGGRLACLVLSLASENLPHLFPGQLSSILRAVLFLAVLAISLLAFVRLCRQEANPFILSSGHTGTRISVKLGRFFGNIVFLLGAALWIAQIVLHFQIIG